MATKDEKAAEKRAEEELVSGRFAAQESGDNSIDVSNPAYVGVDDMYKNHASDTEAPAVAEEGDAKEAEEAAKAHEEEVKAKAPAVGFRGFAPDIVHPTEKVKPQDAYIEGNRALMEKAVADATAPAPSGDSEDDTGSSSTPAKD